MYDYGNVQPLQLAEEFTFYPDTLNLRARWPVGDVKINYKKQEPLDLLEFKY